MKTKTAILFACCLLIAGPINVVQAAGLDLVQAAECVQIILTGGGSVAPKVIPIITNLAKCVDFAPQRTKDLDIAYLVLLSFQFLQKVTTNSKCMLDAISSSKELVIPYINQFYGKNCLSQLIQ